MVKKQNVTQPQTVSLLLIALSVFTICGHANACSLMMKTNSQGTFVGRTLEWWGPVRPGW